VATLHGLLVPMIPVGRADPAAGVEPGIGATRLDDPALLTGETPGERRRARPRWRSLVADTAENQGRGHLEPLPCPAHSAGWGPAQAVALSTTPRRAPPQDLDRAQQETEVDRRCRAVGARPRTHAGSPKFFLAAAPCGPRTGQAPGLSSRSAGSTTTSAASSSPSSRSSPAVNWPAPDSGGPDVDPRTARRQCLQRVLGDVGVRSCPRSWPGCGTRPPPFPGRR
jgi:hypothetical protein